MTIEAPPAIDILFNPYPVTTCSGYWTPVRLVTTVGLVVAKIDFSVKYEKVLPFAKVLNSMREARADCFIPMVFSYL